MDDAFISKNPPAQPSMDYNLLREAGIAYIQGVSGTVWTDYNVHDPGITMLEMLCYAITDLGARANFDIKDLIAVSNAELPVKDFFTAAEVLTNVPVTVKDYRKLLIDQVGIRNAWLEKSTVSEQPLFVNLALKALSYTSSEPIQLNGLYNVQLEFEENEIWGDLNSNILPVVITVDALPYEVDIAFPFWDQASPIWYDPVIITLVNVVVNMITPGEEYFAEFTVTYHVGANPDTTENIGVYITLPPALKDKVPATIEAALVTALTDATATGVIAIFAGKMNFTNTQVALIREQLNIYRNLAEDFFSFSVIRVQEIAINAEIIVAPDTDIEVVLAEFYYQVDKFLNPSVSFYSFAQMIGKGKQVDEIFEGMLLTHGFIDDDELRELKTIDIIYTSDLINIMMGITGVIAVKNFSITNYINNQPITVDVVNCLKLTLSNIYRPRLSIHKSAILVYKEAIVNVIDAARLDTLFNALKAADIVVKSMLLEMEPVLPQGTFKEVDTYYSIQNDFPLTYGIGQAGLPDNATDLRKAQARQMKAYLLFFEQLLADYLSQLAHIRELFSISPAIDKTYFTQPLYTVPNVAALLAGFNPSQDVIKNEILLAQAWDLFQQNTTNPYVLQLTAAAEDKTLFVKRRNRFVNHMLARFGQDSKDFSLLAYFNKKLDGSYEIQEKLDFLSAFPFLSAHRSSAFNYRAKKPDTSPDVWDTDNVSGLEKRVTRFLGFQSSRRRDLVRDIAEFFMTWQEVTDLPGEERYKLLDESSIELLKSTASYNTPALWSAAVDALIALGTGEENYLIAVNGGGKYFFSVMDSTAVAVAVSSDEFNTEVLAREAIAKTIAFIYEKYSGEGFYLIEHILLRPVFVGPTYKDDFLSLTLDYKGDLTIEGEDTYSCRVSAVFPGYMGKFKEPAFRVWVEKIVRTETPAHILPDIYWIAKADDMKTFQEAYKAWLTIAGSLKGVNDIEKKQLSDAKNVLIAQLNTLRTV
ncbi:hypothetical protein [Chitinophaga sp. MM2321]|uniref:hypothetical protein n=1 Tax=Chitinophaga sp. MM2321 TaxID=3137178 RepID=UPI0032D56847